MFEAGYLLWVGFAAIVAFLLALDLGVFHRTAHAVTLKEATIQQYHYQDAAELNAHLQVFLQAYNGGKRLKKLHGQTPYAFVCAQFAQNPGIFIRNPTQDFPGLYS